MQTILDNSQEMDNDQIDVDDGILQQSLNIIVNQAENSNIRVSASDECCSCDIHVCFKLLT